MTRVKGPWFPSYDRQHERSHKRVLVWKPGTQSTRQCKKNLRLKARRIIDSTDPVIISVGDLVIRAVCAEPDPEYSALHLFCAALDVSADTGEPWSVCMQYLMDKFDEQQQRSATEETHERNEAEKPERSSRLRRLLRSLVPGKVRQGYETTAETNLDQSACAGYAQSTQCDAVNRSQSVGDSIAAGEASHD